MIALAGLVNLCVCAEQSVFILVKDLRNGPLPSNSLPVLVYDNKEETTEQA